MLHGKKISNGHASLSYFKWSKFKILLGAGDEQNTLYNIQYTICTMTSLNESMR